MLILGSDNHGTLVLLVSWISGREIDPKKAATPFILPCPLAFDWVHIMPIICPFLGRFRVIRHPMLWPINEIKSRNYRLSIPKLDSPGLLYCRVHYVYQGNNSSQHSLV